MGGTFLCFRQFSIPRRMPKQDSDDRNVSLTTSIMEFFKPSCLWREKNMTWKKLVQHPKKQKKKKKKKKKKQHKVKMVKELTLEEWFSISSPCRNDDDTLRNNMGAEHNTRGYPSSDDDKKSNSRHKFSQQKPLIELVDCGRRSDASCLSSRRSTGKEKKRVSFKLPEEADIFIFCSPKADYEE